MKIQVTPQNLNHIISLIKKSYPDGLQEVLHYPTSVKTNRIAKQLGLSEMKFEHSNSFVFIPLIIEKDETLSRKFIRVRDRDFNDDGFLAFIIEPGDEIICVNGNIKIKCSHPTRHNERAYRVLSKIKF